MQTPSISYIIHMQALCMCIIHHQNHFVQYCFFWEPPQHKCSTIRISECKSVILDLTDPGRKVQNGRAAHARDDEDVFDHHSFKPSHCVKCKNTITSKTYLRLRTLTLKYQTDHSRTQHECNHNTLLTLHWTKNQEVITANLYPDLCFWTLQLWAVKSQVTD